MNSYLILHGWQNHRPKDHWQHWLADRLGDLGHHVVYPQLPNPDAPDLDVWLGELARRLDELNNSGGTERVVLGHSASALLWLHAVARGQVRGDEADRVLLVGPPSRAVVAQYPEVAGFAPPAADFTLPGDVRLVAGDDDPHCPENARVAYGDPFALPTELIAGAGHLDLVAGYGSWPAVLDWCLDGSTRLVARPA